MYSSAERSQSDMGAIQYGDMNSRGAPTPPSEPIEVAAVKRECDGSLAPSPLAGEGGPKSRMRRIERSEMASIVRYEEHALALRSPAGYLESERSRTEPSRSARSSLMRHLRNDTPRQ